MANQSLPVIVAMGGISAAGRSSGHHAYRRMVHGVLDRSTTTQTMAALARLMDAEQASLSDDAILRGTLVRRIEAAAFNPDAVPWNQRVEIQTESQGIRFTMARRDFPPTLPPGWEVVAETVTHLEVVVQGDQRFLMPSVRAFEVKSAGQLPTGFDPAAQYPSRNHPRGLQMGIFAVSDALGALGIEWSDVTQRVSADQISVYAGSAMGQLDQPGAGGMLAARANGLRVTSKFCPLSMAEMPADFTNAYVLGSLGSTGASLGACASFLYNLRHAIDDIRSGRARVALVGGAEAPVNPQVMEGYAAMGALATEKELRALDNLGEGEDLDFQRACRPFGENCGFTIAESAQTLVLFDDALAVEMGASILGAATDVFVNADGYKKSISGPGVGNYITMGKALAAARAIVGDDAIKRGGLVQAHGTGTPQNRVTESAILSRVAQAFNIDAWPVGAVKSYVGHSLGSAAGDQIAATLGVWEHGWLPGITTVDAIADDVSQAGLSFSLSHCELPRDEQSYAIINAKGFGGNNASATLLSPNVTEKMLAARHGSSAMARWRDANNNVRAAQSDYDEAMRAGTSKPRYFFDYNVLHDADVDLSDDAVTVGEARISLNSENPFADMAGS